MAELEPTEHIISLSSFAEYDENELSEIIHKNEGTIDWIKIYEHYKLETSALGLYLMGRMHNNGDGVEQNYEKAKYYYEMAAEKGNTDAMNALGHLYHSGEGVKRNLKKAVHYYEKAIENGNSDAADKLADLLSEATKERENIEA